MGCPVLFLVQKREREKKKLYGDDGTYVTLSLRFGISNPSYVVRGTCRVAKYLNGSEASIVKGVI